MSKYGIELNGDTGVLSGYASAGEPIAFDCKITAVEEGVLELFEADMHVEIGYFQYDKDTLICQSGGSFKPIIPAGSVHEWSNWRITCAPIIDGLHINSASGMITCPSAKPDGGITDVDDKWLGQPGGVCTVSATHTEPQMVCHKNTTTCAAIKFASQSLADAMDRRRVRLINYKGGSGRIS